MLDFLTPELFDGLVWAVIFIGGAFAVLRLVRDLTGPPRWPPDSDSSGPPGPPDQPNEPPPEAPEEPLAPDHE